MNETPKFYTPGEVARRLGISQAMLRYYHTQGRIEGTSLGNTTLYTEEQIRAFEQAPKKKTGPKPRDEPSPAAVA